MNAPYETHVDCPGPCDRCGDLAFTQNLCKTCSNPVPARPLPSAEQQRRTRIGAEIRADRRAARARNWSAIKARRVKREHEDARDVALVLALGRAAS